jgi:hypothetical protein
MKKIKIIGIALAAICLLGCKKGLHDPALRQQLTTMISSLDDQNGNPAEQASEDIHAILSANSAKMSPEQEQKLSSAGVLLSQIAENVALRELHASLHPNDNNPPDNTSSDISKVKATLSEVAASF